MIYRFSANWTSTAYEYVKLYWKLSLGGVSKHSITNRTLGYRRLIICASNLFRFDSCHEYLFQNSYGFTVRWFYSRLMVYALRYSDKPHIPKSRWEIRGTNSFIALTTIFQKVSLLVSVFCMIFYFSVLLYIVPVSLQYHPFSYGTVTLDLSVRDPFTEGYISPAVKKTDENSLLERHRARTAVLVFRPGHKGKDDGKAKTDV